MFLLMSNYYEFSIKNQSVGMMQASDQKQIKSVVQIITYTNDGLTE